MRPTGKERSLMAIRKKRKAPKRTKTKKASKRSPKKTTTSNAQKAHSAAYYKLQKQVNTAWAALRKNIQKKASADVILRDRNRLLLLLGECNYMTRQCAQLVSSKKGKK